MKLCRMAAYGCGEALHSGTLFFCKFSSSEMRDTDTKPSKAIMKAQLRRLLMGRNMGQGKPEATDGCLFKIRKLALAAGPRERDSFSRAREWPSESLHSRCHPHSQAGEARQTPRGPASWVGAKEGAPRAQQSPGC